MAEEAGRGRGYRRRRRLAGVAATAEQGGAVLVEVLVCEGDSRRTARVGGSSRAGRCRAVGEEARTSNAGGAWAHLTESTGLGGAPWLRSGRGEGVESGLACGKAKCGSGGRREGSKSAAVPSSARSLSLARALMDDAW
jgi:hypothetical protein